MEAYRPHPIELVVADDLRRSRLTVFLRLLLAVPHYVWLTVWSLAAVVVAVIDWIATLVAGRSPAALHAFLERYLRYATHVTAYVNLLANPYPRFGGTPGYAIDLEVAPPAPQARWKTALRFVLVIPAAVFAGLLNQVMGLIAFACWFVALAVARVPRGLRDFGAYCLRFQQQTAAYALFLTDRYPSLAQRPEAVGAPADTTPA